MSAVKLIKFGNKTMFSPQGTRQYRAVLLSDSKGIKLKQERYDPIHTEIKSLTADIYVLLIYSNVRYCCTHYIIFLGRVVKL
jgi:hypothetical protein